MARKSDKERVDTWRKRIDGADRSYKDWADKFRVERGEEYFQGLQWDEREAGQERYVINLIYPTIKSRQPTLLFYKPHFLVRARPQRMDDMGSMAEARARLREDALNTFVEDERIGFQDETELAVFEALFLYGVLEVGYTADFIDNPNAGKPILKEDSDEPEIDKAGNPLLAPDQTIDSESLFVKRIPANTWRFPVNSKNKLAHNDWVGYYEWHYPEDIRKNPRYKNAAQLKASGRMKGDVNESSESTSDTRYRDMVKIWKIWDLRAKTRYVFGEWGDKFLLEEPFKFLPFSFLVFDPILNSGYPLPFVFNLVPPQNELNETREMQRVHRKRFLRKYAAQQGKVLPGELEKLEEQRDGVIIWTQGPDAITPIADGPLDAAVARNIPQTKEDFNEIAGSSGEQRGVPESETATQANILDVRSRIRESRQRVQVSRWLAQTGKLMLQTMQANMALPFWIKTVVDPMSPGAFQEATGVAATWQQITTEDLGDLNYDVAVEVESLAPVTEISERQDWTQVLAIITNPQVFMTLAMSPVLLRKTLNYYGIRNEKEIAEIQKMGTLLMMLQAQSAQQQQAGPGEAAPGGGSPSPGPTPDNAQIAEQLQNQMPVANPIPV